MAFKTTRIWTRPNSYTPYYTFKPGVLLHYKNTYDDTGKRISLIIEDSKDLLQLASISTWINEASYNEFMNDATSIITRSDMDAYNSANNITSVWTTETI
jgi:hypothetical protein